LKNVEGSGSWGLTAQAFPAASDATRQITNPAERQA
jgi:hypothetical protein